MGSGRDLYNACCLFQGQPYSTAPGRTDPNSGHKDCSGLVAAGFEVCQGYKLGAYVSTTIFKQSVDAGLEIPRWAAENIVGALLYKPENPYLGWGANGHIAVSDGYGGTIEATPPRVQRLPLSYNAPWSTRATLAIDLDYSNYGEGSQIPIPEPILRKRAPDMTVMWIDFYGIKAYCVQAGIIVHEFNGPPNPDYGLPQDALDFASGTNCGLIKMSGSEWTTLLKRIGVIEE
jgi:hypothetical protein